MGPIAASMEVPTLKAGTEYTITLNVTNAAAILGYHVVLGYDHDQFEVLGVEKGAMHDAEIQSFFDYNRSSSDLEFSGAVFGDNFAGEEMARIRVLARQDCVVDFETVELDVRDWSMEQVEMDLAVVNKGIIPTTFGLSQNYPNPFNPATTIELSLPVETDYNLTIYNVTGQVVESISGHGSAGIVTIVWDASNRSSGVYFYKLKTNTFAETKKMVLLK
jgi:hypothetical protein